MDMGAVFVDFNEDENVVDEVIRLSDGIGAHGVFVTAPKLKAYKSAIGYIGGRISGKVMCIGLRESFLRGCKG